jgi:hypothetical protein
VALCSICGVRLAASTVTKLARVFRAAFTVLISAQPRLGSGRIYWNEPATEPNGSAR